MVKHHRDFNVHPTKYKVFMKAFWDIATTDFKGDASTSKADEPQRQNTGSQFLLSERF
jgi:hypothetical protein